MRSEAAHASGKAGPAGAPVSGLNKKIKKSLRTARARVKYPHGTAATTTTITTMSTRITKAFLATLPEPARVRVEEWRERYKRATVSVKDAEYLYFDEDAKVTMINLTTGKAADARGAGEFAGHAGLQPGKTMPLPRGIMAVVSGFFLGHAWLSIYRGAATIPALQENNQKDLAPAAQ